MSLITQGNACISQHNHLTALCCRNVSCKCLTQSPFCFLVQFSNQRHPRGYTWSKKGPGRTVACRWEIDVCGDLTQDFWGKAMARMVSSFGTQSSSHPASSSASFLPLPSLNVALSEEVRFLYLSSQTLGIGSLSSSYINYMWNSSTYPSRLMCSWKFTPFLGGEVTTFFRLTMCFVDIVSKI